MNPTSRLIKILTLNLLIIFVFYGNIKSDDKYTLDANGKVKVVAEHKYTEKHYFKNYIINGTFEDNLGNYGFNETSVMAEYKEGKVIKLQWSGMLTYQNNKIIFARGIRKKGVDEAGVGRSILFAGESPLNILNNLECNYAIKFFKNNAFAKWVCNLSNTKLNILQNLD